MTGMKRAIAVCTLVLTLPLAAQESTAVAEELLRLIDVKAIAGFALASSQCDDNDRELRSRLANQLDETMLLAMYGRFLSDRYSVSELRQMIAFFKTDAGQHSLEVLSTLGSFGIETDLLHSTLAEEIRAQIEKESNDPVRITMSDLQTLAMAIESYATDTNEYPRTDIHGLPRVLSPVYIKEVLMKDGWGNTFFYDSSGERYRLVSAGADGQFEWHSRTLPAEGGTPLVENDNSDRDLIFEDGDFVQRPRQEEHRQ